MKKNIVFIHAAVSHSQFSTLQEFLNENNIANAYLLCEKEFVDYYKFNNKKNSLDFNKIFSYSLESNRENPYYFSNATMEGAQTSLGIYKSIEALREEINIDLIVAHGSISSPHLLFNHIDIPIISYIEFPSYHAHGWDNSFEPSKEQQIRMNDFEMLSYYQALKSDAVIVPTQYAKSMFPKELQNNIHVQMEGFNPKRIHEKSASFIEKENNINYIGFFARDLPSAKGFHQFIKISKKILENNKNIKFIIIGSPKLLYSFEDYYIKEFANFKEYILKTENIDPQYYMFFDHLEYDKYSACLYDIDLVLYPLQFGSANWGFFESLLRGAAIIGSNKCFLPEFIQNNYSGLLRDYDDVEGWATAAIDLLKNKEKCKYLRLNAKKEGEKLFINNVFKNYMNIFEQTIKNYIPKNTRFDKKLKNHLDPKNSFPNELVSSSTSKFSIDILEKRILKEANQYLEHDIIKREIHILNMLQKNNMNWAPKIINSTEDYIILEYYGVPITQYNIPTDYKAQMHKILNDLNSLKIKHNDIIFNNHSKIYVKNKKLYIIDFEWASINNDFSCGINISNKKKPFGSTNDNNAIAYLETLYNQKH